MDPMLTYSIEPAVRMENNQTLVSRRVGFGGAFRQPLDSVYLKSSCVPQKSSR